MARTRTITGGRDATAAVIPGRYALSVGMPNLPAPDGWEWTPLSSIARLESGHTPSRRHSEYWGGSIPWVGIRDATGNHGRVIFETNEYTNELGIENSSARVLPKDTVCLSRTASVGYVVMMGCPMATSQDFVNWICSDKLNPHFLKYVLLSEREALNIYAVGSVHQTIYFPEAKAFHICMPARKVQDAIVDVLNGLDDKIELNRRMNETLEAMARAIFKDWFVDFGPTRAKMAMRGEGPQKENTARAPYLAPDIWSLFPDRLETGEIPQGWSERSIYEISDVIYGAPFASALFNTTKQGIPLIRIRDLAKENPSVWTTESHPKGYRVKQGDIVVGMDGEFRAYLWGGAEAWLNQRVCVFKPKTGYSAAFVRNSIIGPLARVEATEIATTVIHLGKNDIDQFNVIVPATEVVAVYDELAQPLYNRIVENKVEIDTLAATRDLLLPKLMSGEIHVKDAEALVDEVA